MGKRNNGPTVCVQSDIRAFGITGGLENDGGNG